MYVWDSDAVPVIKPEWHCVYNPSQVAFRVNIWDWSCLFNLETRTQESLPSWNPPPAFPRAPRALYSLHRIRWGDQLNEPKGSIRLNAAAVAAAGFHIYGPSLLKWGTGTQAWWPAWACGRFGECSRNGPCPYFPKRWAQKSIKVQSVTIWTDAILKGAVCHSATIMYQLQWGSTSIVIDSNGL